MRSCQPLLLYICRHWKSLGSRFFSDFFQNAWALPLNHKNVRWQDTKDLEQWDKKRVCQNQGCYSKVLSLEAGWRSKVPRGRKGLRLQFIPFWNLIYLEAFWWISMVPHEFQWKDRISKTPKWNSPRRWEGSVLGTVPTPWARKEWHSGAACCKAGCSPRPIHSSLWLCLGAMAEHLSVS